MQDLPSSLVHEQQLDEVLAEYFAALEAGQPFDRAAFVARHPELADALHSFFDAKEDFERQARPLLPLNPDTSLPCQVGDYDLLEEIGHGGMGVVYRARHRTLGREVALKRMRAELPAREDEARRFRTEAAVVAALEHPHVVPVYDSGESDGRPWFTMRLIEGGSLAQHLKQGPLPPRAAATLLATVARAIHHAHQRGILHRDLKPSNILLDEQGQPHVTDFGLAKRLDRSTELTASHAIIGSVPYMAPEQAGGQVRQLTTACDVWALGVILYQCLTGRLPFEGETVLVALQRIRTDPAPSLAIPAVHRDLETITLHCLHKEPGRRYASAADLADDLDRWLRGEPIAARATGTVEKVWLWARRNRVLAGLMVLLLLVLLSVAVGATLAAVSFNELAGRERQQAEGADRARAAEAERRSEAEKEREKFRAERDAKEKALIRADGLRLTAHATAALPTDPALALLLAIQGARKAPGLLANDTLLTALDACHEMRTILVPPGGAAAGLRYSPDGKRLWVTAGYGPVRALDPARGAVTITWPCPGMGGPHHAAFSPDGGHVAIWSETPFESGYRNPPRMVVLTDRVARVYTASGKFVCILRGHTDRLGSATFSPDGKRLVTASQDGTVRVWDRDTGKELQRFQGTGPFGSACFSPDGKRILGVAAMRRIESGIRKSLERDPDQLQDIFGGCTCGPYGRSGNCPANLFMVWDVGTSKPIATLGQSPLARILDSAAFGPDHGDFSPDGKCVLLGFTRKHGASTSTAVIWNVEANKPLGNLSNGSGEQPPTFSPDGRYILYVEGKLAHILFMSDAGHREERAVLRGHEGAITSASFSRDGRRVLTASEDRTVRVWDAETGAVIACFRGHTKRVLAAAFHPDGDEVASAGEDDTIRIWRVQPPRPHVRPLVPRMSRVGDIRYSPDRSRLLLGAEDAARLWDVRTGAELAVYRSSHDLKVDDASRAEILGGAWSVEFSPDGRRVLVVNGERMVHLDSWQSGKKWPFRPVHLFDTATGKELATLGPLTSSPTVATFSPDGRTVLVAESGGMPTVVVRGGHTWGGGSGLAPLAVARLYDSHTGKVLWTTSAHPQGVAAAAFSPDGKRVLTCCRTRPPDLWAHKGLVRLWDVTTGKELLRFETREDPRSATFSPDGKVLALQPACYGPAAELRDAKTGALLHNVAGQLVGAFSPDSRLVVSLGVEQRDPRAARGVGSSVWVVNLLDVPSGKVKGVLRGHEDAIRSATFSADGRRIVTSSDDRTVRLWDVATGKELLRLTLPKKLRRALFTPGEERVISIDEDGAALQWELDLAGVAQRFLPRGLTPEERARYEIE